jgi:hypothetical protein
LQTEGRQGRKDVKEEGGKGKKEDEKEIVVNEEGRKEVKGERKLRKEGS